MKTQLTFALLLLAALSTSREAQASTCEFKVSRLRTDFSAAQATALCYAQDQLQEIDDRYVACILDHVPTLTWDKKVYVNGNEQSLLIQNCLNNNVKYGESCVLRLLAAKPTYKWDDATWLCTQGKWTKEGFASFFNIDTEPTYTQCLLRMSAHFEDGAFIMHYCKSDEDYSCLIEVKTAFPERNYSQGDLSWICSAGRKFKIGRLPGYKECMLDLMRDRLDTAHNIQLCLENSKAYASKTPKIVSVDFGNLTTVLDVVASQQYPQRKEFLLAVSEAVRRQSRASTLITSDANASQLFAVIALDPFMRSLDSAWMRKDALPAWQRDVSKLKSAASVESLRDFFPTPNVSRNAIAILHAGFSAVRDSLGDVSEQKALEQIQKALGIAGSSTFRPRDEKLATLVQLLERHADLVTKIQTNPRTAGIGHSIGAVIEYLKANY